MVANIGVEQGGGMKRWNILLIALLALGCSKEASYRAVIEEQVAAYEELTEVLKSIKDESTMAAGRERLRERYERFAEVAKRAQALGPPSEALRERLRVEESTLKLAFTRFEAERGRIKALPGGEAFLKSPDFSGK